MSVRTRQGIVMHEHERNGARWHTYSIDGKRAVGVTTALKGIPKDALVGWAAGVVADHVVNNIYDVKKMLDSGGPGPTKYFLKELPNQKRDTAAVRGTDVHALAEKYVRGDEVEVPEQIRSYVESYAAFIEDFEPVSLHEELVVASREHMYCGKLDSIQQIPGYGCTLVDYKTSNGVYGETALQVAAYRYAEVYVDPDGNEQPMPEIDSTYVLHIQADGYELRPLYADRAAFDKFLAAKRNYLENVQSRKLDKLIGDPVFPAGRDVA